MKHEFKSKQPLAFFLVMAIILTMIPFHTSEALPSSYKTDFDWSKSEEVLNIWPLEAGLTKTGVGVGTAGFSYCQF